jgi:hypothetical protein
MGDSAQILAFNVDGMEAQERAAKVLAWLAGEGIIESLPTDSGLQSLAHRPGPKVLEAVVAGPPGVFDFRTGRTNGMEIHSSVRAQLEAASDDMPGFACPKCETEIEADDVFPLIEDLASPFKPVPEIACHKCRKKTAIDALVTENCAFANLTLRFWNWWPLKPSFVEQVERECGARAKIVYDRV